MSLLSNVRLRRTLLATAIGLAGFLSESVAWTSTQLNDMMMDGINAGQYFENKDWRTRTDLPAISQETFDRIKDRGLNHVRLPITWGYRVDANGTINPTFLTTVQTTVDRALDAGLVVVLNVHHETWFENYWGPTWNRGKIIRLYPTEYASDGKLGNYRESSGGRTAQAQMLSIYGQIVRRFQGPKYDKVVFEGLNEPRTEEFTNSSVNELNRLLFEVVQNNYDATKGGARQTFMMSVNNANNAMELDAITVPTYGTWSLDDRKKRLMATIHYYHTQAWTHGTDSTWDINATWNEGDYDQLIDRFNIMRDTNYAGVPINIGEFAVQHDAGNYKNPGNLENWYMAVTAAAKNRGFSATAWDDGGGFGILSHEWGSNGRKTGQFFLPTTNSTKDKMLTRVNNYQLY